MTGHINRLLYEVRNKHITCNSNLNYAENLALLGP